MSRHNVVTCTNDGNLTRLGDETEIGLIHVQLNHKVLLDATVSARIEEIYQCRASVKCLGAPQVLSFSHLLRSSLPLDRLVSA